MGVASHWIVLVPLGIVFCMLVVPWLYPRGVRLPLSAERGEVVAKPTRRQEEIVRIKAEILRSRERLWELEYSENRKEVQ